MSYDDPFDVAEAELVETAAPQVQSMGMVRTQAGYMTAQSVQVPRALEAVRKRAVEEACLLGEEGFYGWGSGKDRVEGASQELAHMLARNWGNCVVGASRVEDAGDSWIIYGQIVDLETGFTLERPFRQSKNWKVYGKHDEARKEDIRFQIGASKAARNVILHYLPAWLVKKALAECKRGARQKLDQYIKDKGLPAAQDLVLAELAKRGVKAEAVLAKFAVANKSGLDVDQLVLIRADLSAIDRGQERPEDLYPMPAAESPLERAAAKAKAAPSPAPAPPPAAAPEEDPRVPKAGRLTPEQVVEIQVALGAAGLTVKGLINMELDQVETADPAATTEKLLGMIAERRAKTAARAATLTGGQLGELRRFAEEQGVDFDAFCRGRDIDPRMIPEGLAAGVWVERLEAQILDAKGEPQPEPQAEPVVRLLTEAQVRALDEQSRKKGIPPLTFERMIRDKYGVSLAELPATKQAEVGQIIRDYKP